LPVLASLDESFTMCLELSNIENNEEEKEEAEETSSN